MDQQVGTGGARGMGGWVECRPFIIKYYKQNIKLNTKCFFKGNRKFMKEKNQH